MKKRIISIMAAAAVITSLCSCSQAGRVNYNMSKEADRFNVSRRLSVINMRTDKPIFELVGNFSISNNTSNELVVTVETAANEYKKHYVYLNEYTMYVIEDLGGADVSNYKYEINFLPEMIQPIEITSKD